MSVPVLEPAEAAPARPWATGRRAAVVIMTSTAVLAGAVQGTAQAAPPPHSIAYQTQEFTYPVSGQGCRVGHSFRVDASSAAEARNIHSRAIVVRNGQNNVVPLQVTSSYRSGQTSFTVTAVTHVRGVATQDCIAQRVAPHRGRDLRQIPGWARGILAGLASTAIYLSVTVFATAAAAAATGGTGSVVAAAIGGCVGGALSAYAAARILGVTDKGLLIGNTVTSCITGLAASTALGAGVRRLESWVVESQTLATIRSRVGNWIGDALTISARDTQVALRDALGRL